MNKKLLVLVLTIALFSSNSARAHVSGQTIEKNLGEYSVDIGYDSPDINPMAGEPVRFDFRLYKGEKKELVEFSKMWFKASLGNVPMIAGRLAKDELIPTGLLFTFPQGGEYDITVRFSDKDKTLAETTFPISVGKAVYETGPAQNSKNKWVVLGGSVLLICLVGYWFGFRKKTV